MGVSMNSKRSYLDTLNAGRQRRPHTTLEELNRSLETLEQRIARVGEEPPPSRYQARAAEPRYPSAQPYAPRPSAPAYAAQQPYEEPRAYRRPAAPAPAAPTQGYNYQTLARDIDRVRGQEDGVAAVGKIAGELRGLREELRHQMTAGIHREFEALRADITRAAKSGPSARDSAELGLEFERLSGSIQMLADKSDDKNINMLRLELEQVKAALDVLAREESVQAVDRRFDDFDRRWSAFEDRVDADARNRSDGPGLAMLTERLEQISSAVANLPESLSLRSLEEKVRTLAGAVDHFTSRDDRSSDTLGLIDERLDEISRAIVASAMAAQAPGFDPEPFERIEQRIVALAAQIEEVVEDRPTAEVIDRLNMLSGRVDDLAAHSNLPEQAIDRLGQQIAYIADRIDGMPAMPDADYIFQGLEQRFDVLSGMMERRQGDALEQGNMLFRELEQRLDEVADRLDQRMPQAQVDSAGIMDAIDARFAALASRLEANASDPGREAAIHGLESRLEDISTRLDISAAKVSGIDPDLIRSLEAQVAGLSEHLSRPGTPLPEFEDISPRLDQIEQSLAGAHDSIIGAAREAAESAVRSLAGSSANQDAVSGLAQDLKTLEALARRSDERNSRTFEAIHDTLLKIVDRLGSLEGGQPAEAVPTPKIAVVDVPSMDIDEPLPLAGDLADLDGRAGDMQHATAQRTPAEAAAAAALAALGSDTIAGERAPVARRKSMLGGLARVLGGKKEAETLPASSGPVMALDVPSVELDQALDPRAANRPLEPGSGAPDLNAIMKRVRDERGQPAARQDGTEVAKADFIAAARRAAQAAAAEADALKRQSTVAGPVRALRIGDLLKARRKPILMAAAAIMMALAGLQLGKAFMSAPAHVASSDAPPVLAVQTADISPAASVGEPSMKTDPVRVVRPSESSASRAKDDMAVQAAVAPTTGSMDEELAAMPADPAMDSDLAVSAADADTAGAVPTATSAVPATHAALDVPADAGPLALRQAAAEGDPKALFEIGSRYAEGRGVGEDMAAAAKWYERSAELGFAPAQYRVGNFYEKGIGFARDIHKAKTWYQLAAAQGNASAMHNLAVLFAMATDGVTDNEAAARLFQEAADLGVKDSQFNLGILAAKGVGMPQNLEEVLQMVRPRRQDRRQGRSRQARRDRQRAAARTARESQGDDRIVEGQAARSGRQLRRRAGILAGRDPVDHRRNRHEEGGPEHPAHPQQERLRGRRRRRRDGPEDEERHHGLPGRQRPRADGRGR